MHFKHFVFTPTYSPTKNVYYFPSHHIQNKNSRTKIRSLVDNKSTNQAELRQNNDNFIKDEIAYIVSAMFVSQ